MDILAAKLISLFLMQLLTLAAGLLPLKAISYLRSSESPAASSRGEFIISLMNCFSGGVFLATTFLHLLPEVTETMEEVLKTADIDTDFPLAEFIVCAGFFLIMLLEHLVMSLQHHHESSRSPLAQSWERSKEPQTSYGSLSHSADHTHNDMQQRDVESEAPHDCQQTLLANIESRDDNCVHIIHPTHHQTHHQDTSQIQGIRSILLLLALSLHTVFEGLALGLQSTSQQVWTLFLAISIHKVLMAFTLGIQFTTTFSNKCRVVLFIVVFSLMSPLGVGIGTAVTSAVDSGFAVDVSSTVLQAIATGTFVYVTFFEVLQKEVGQDHSLLKVFVVIVGFVVVALINLFSPHE